MTEKDDRKPYAAAERVTCPACQRIGWFSQFCRTCFGFGWITLAEHERLSKLRAERGDNNKP